MAPARKSTAPYICYSYRALTRISCSPKKLISHRFFSSNTTPFAELQVVEINSNHTLRTCIRNLIHDYLAHYPLYYITMSDSSSTQEHAKERSRLTNQLDEREANLDLAARLYQAQADTRKAQKDHSKATRRRFLQMWPTMRHKLGANPAECPSDRAQQGFRNALEKACNSHHPDWPRRDMQWCPVLGG